MPLAELALPGRHNRLERAGRRSRSRSCSGCRRPRSGPPPARSSGSSTGSRPSPSSTGSGSSTTRRGPSRTRSSPRSGRSTRRSCSSPAAGTRASTWPASVRSSPSGPRPRSSSARAARTSRHRFRAAGPGPDRAGRHARGGRPPGGRDRRRAARRVSAAARLRPTVLLSPAAASFDMFVDYEARGRAFKAAVATWPRRTSAMTAPTTALRGQTRPRVAASGAAEDAPTRDPPARLRRSSSRSSRCRRSGS